MFRSKEGEEFSPWDDEPFNLLRFNKPQKTSCPSQKRYKTVERADTYRSQMQITPYRSPRAIMSVSKVNFFTLDSEVARAIPPRQQSKGKFEGPRLTFYLKMNPSQCKSFHQARSSPSPPYCPAKRD